MANGVIQKGGDLVCPVDDTGCFTKEVTDFAGQYVKVTESDCIAGIACGNFFFTCQGPLRVSSFTLIHLSGLSCAFPI